MSFVNELVSCSGWIVKMYWNSEKLSSGSVRKTTILSKQWQHLRTSQQQPPKKWRLSSEFLKLERCKRMQILWISKYAAKCVLVHYYSFRYSRERVLQIFLYIGGLEWELPGSSLRRLSFGKEMKESLEDSNISVSSWSTDSYVIDESACSFRRNRILTSGIHSAKRVQPIIFVRFTMRTFVLFCSRMFSKVV